VLTGNDGANSPLNEKITIPKESVVQSEIGRARRDGRAACDEGSVLQAPSPSDRMLCSLPIKFGRVWADCRTKTFALAVDITMSDRDSPGDQELYAD
jgi:hypothetical protein